MFSRSVPAVIQCFVLSLFFCAVAEAAEAQVTEESRPALALLDVSLVNEASLQALSNDAQWQKLLFFAPRWLLSPASLVDDDRFFLSPIGKKNSTEELKETVRVFTSGSEKTRQEALCKYPARRRWLEEKLGNRFPDPDPANDSEICKRLRVFRKTIRANKASLIFSSYYPGNPASLFGHTLLKFARVQEDGGSGNELLDFGFNHSAFPTTQNPFLYAAMGLTGFFPGYVSLLPYYVKVQEYNNAESRDLWEYELSLTPEEVDSALLSIFELSNHRIDYYYFDDNCSLLMLAILDVARPQNKLVEKFSSWVIPADTVRVVFNTNGLVTEVKFRPSNVRRYLQLELQLNERERHAFNALVESKRAQQFSFAALAALTSQEQTHVLDTLLEYIDADEKLAGSMEPEHWKQERQDVLTRRAQIGISSIPVKVEAPVQEGPHESYPPTRVSAGAVFSRARTSAQSVKPALLLGWRPALHSLDSPWAGMDAELGISFLQTELLLNQSNFLLKEFLPLQVESLATGKPHLPSTSWRFELGFRHRCFSGCAQTFIGAELGQAWKLGRDAHHRLNLRGALHAGQSASKGPFLESGITTSFNFSLSEKQRWTSGIKFTRQVSWRDSPAWLREAHTSFVFRPLPPWEISLSAETIQSELNLSSRLFYYF